jgi:hypothetical protein
MDDDLHFKSGKMGRLARFFARRRAAGDPYDETLVLPALIVISVMRLNDLKRLDDWTVPAALIITGVTAGAWLGASLGVAGGIRVMLRSVLVGIFEAAGYAVLNGEIDRHQGYLIAVELIYGNFIFFWLTHQLVYPVRDIALISEREWQETSPRRAMVHKVIRITLGAEELKGQSTGIAVTVWIIRLLVPLLASAWVSWTFFGVSPYAFLKSRVAP